MGSGLIFDLTRFFTEVSSVGLRFLIRSWIGHRITPNNWTASLWERRKRTDQPKHDPTSKHSPAPEVLSFIVTANAATARRTAAIARSRGRRSTDTDVGPATEETRDVMQSIQARIDELRREVPEYSSYTSERAGEEDAGAVRGPKRARSALTVSSDAQQTLLPVSASKMPTQPSNAIVDTRDGRTKIYVGGYELTRSTITRVKIAYRCSFYRNQACPAKLKFYASMMDYGFLNSIAHTCTPPSRCAPPLDATIKTMIVKATMQREVHSLAVGSADTPHVIWDKVSAKFYDREDNVVVHGMSKAQVTKRAVAVSCQDDKPQLFQSHHVWTNPNMKTEYNTVRLIGWAHPSLLSLLRYGKISLLVDGTFRCVPRHFRQCIVVMVYDQGTKLYVPAFYVLAASKTFDSYWNVLQYVSDACGQRIDPKQVVCDFEMALIQAVGDWFPETDIVGCFFHFKQACSRKMTKLRIPPAEIKLAMERGALDMLTVVDPDKIEKQGIRWARSRIKDRCTDEGCSY